MPTSLAPAWLVTLWSHFCLSPPRLHTSRPFRLGWFTSRVNRGEFLNPQRRKLKEWGRFSYFHSLNSSDKGEISFFFQMGILAFLKGTLLLKGVALETSQGCEWRVMTNLYELHPAEADPPVAQMGCTYPVLQTQNPRLRGTGLLVWHMESLEWKPGPPESFLPFSRTRKENSPGQRLEKCWVWKQKV